MYSDEGKLFIGGLSWETTEEKMKEYFGKYGEVLQAVIMRDKVTTRPRGFGFLLFADPSVLDRVLQDKHVLYGRIVDAKRALPREEQHISARSGNSNAARTIGGTGGGNVNFKTKKIFVGGLPPTLTQEGFHEYFETYGTVTDAVVMYDQITNRPRGFGFISFDAEDAVDRVLHKTFHELNGKLVEVKRACPKDANPNSGSDHSMASGAYQSYGGSNINTNSYAGRMDANSFMQPQAAGGGFPSYDSSGYGAPAYGYGAGSNGSGYGVSGYGSAAGGYSGPLGAYRNPNAPAAGYISGPPGAPRSPWNNQAPSGYGSTGYGANTGYGAPASWNTPGGGGGAVGTAGYGNHGYGCDGYGENEGSSCNQNGYGIVVGHGGSGNPTNSAAGGGDQLGAGSGNMSSTYGDMNGNSGYPNSWRSDPSQGGVYGASQVSGPGVAAGYGRYGGVQSRQAQQQ